MDPLLDPEDSSLEEGLLRAGRDVHLSPEARNRTLAAMGLATVGGAGVAAGAAQSAKAGWWAWVTSKSGALVAAGVVASIGATTAAVQLRSAPPETTQRAPSVATPPEAEPQRDSAPSPDVGAAADADTKAAPTSAEGEAALTLAELSPAEDAADSDSSAPVGRKSTKDLSSAERPTQPAPARAGQLRAELSRLAQVEQALSQGRSAEALRLLQGYRAEFEPARLGLEAEVLTIQALAAAGARAEAGRRAARFVERHPDSPLRARAERFVP